MTTRTSLGPPLPPHPRPGRGEEDRVVLNIVGFCRVSGDSGLGMAVGTLAGFRPFASPPPSSQH